MCVTMLSFVLFLYLCACAHGLQVNTTEGVVEGGKAGDGDYYTYYGIPYAGPASGQNRFRAPVAPSRYPGLFHAIDSDVICAQPTARGLIGKEDCLTLSIFTKNVTSSKPVIVWLHSEEYTTSNTQLLSYKRFVEENIVFVTMNYRLSIFGFLCLGVEEAPGNAGLKDVIQGLKWIKSNIAAFGGDPKNVVLMGHGSGAAIVDFLTMSPKAENLFHKAIALSGSALAPGAVAYDPVGYANLLASKLGYEGKTNAELAKHLVHTDINVLNSALSEFKFKNNTPLFAPCIENPKLTTDNVLTGAPIHILRSGKYSQIPYIAGYTTREGTMRAEEAIFGNWLEAMQANFTNFLQVDLELNSNKTAVSNSIRDFYFGNNPISMGTIEDFLDYQGDTLVVVAVIRGAKERGLSSNSDVRLFEFGYVGTRNSDWIYNQIPLRGARHGSLINYLFDFDLKPGDEVVMKSIVKRFAGFAYNGNPVPINGTNFTAWTAITKEQTNYLYYAGLDSPAVNQTIHAEEPRFDPHRKIISFWNSLYSKYYHPPGSINSSSITVGGLFFVLLSQFMLRLL